MKNTKYSLKVKKLDNYPIFEDMFDYPGLMLWQLTHLWQRQLHNRLKVVDLTFVQFTLLAALEVAKSNNIDSTLTNIAKGIYFDVMMTSNVVKTLEKKNLIVRKKHPTDSRAIILDFTDEGFESLEKAKEISFKFRDDFFNKLNSDLTSFKSSMLKLFNENLD